MNEKKPKWNCPVCNKAAHFENLFLDGFYIQLLQSPQFRALSTNDIVFKMAKRQIERENWQSGIKLGFQEAISHRYREIKLNAAFFSSFFSIFESVK